MRPILALILSFISLSVLAQTNTNTIPAIPEVPGTDGTSLLLILIPLVVPLVVAVVKFVLPKLPVWTLPILAPALGALVDYLTTLATGTAASPVLAAVFGSAGVGLREIIDQVKQASRRPPQPS